MPNDPQPTPADLQQTAAELWQQSNVDGRRAMLARLRGRNWALGVHVLEEEDLAGFDRLARELDLAPVLVSAVVDASGLSTLVPAVIDPAYAGEYHARPWTGAAPASRPKP